MAPVFVDLSAPNGHKWAQPVGLFINNEFVESNNARTLAVVNPATEEEIAQVALATEKDLNEAVQAAADAFSHPDWRSLSGTDRGKLMFRLADLMEKNCTSLASAESLNTGKAYSIALEGDVEDAIKIVRYYAGYADKFFGQVIDTGADKLAYTLKEPIGVCGLIVPWNFPLNMAITKFAPALCCGNTVVLKPSEVTPLSVLYLATLVKEAGFPPGVVNIINGLGPVVGAAMATHKQISKISFTGSTRVGKELMKLGSTDMKKLTLETGGKSPLIVFEDSNLDLAAQWAHLGFTFNQGELCTATTRILVQDTIFDRFLDALKSTTLKYPVGQPFEEKTYLGPLVSKAHFDRVREYVRFGKEEGAKDILDGCMPPGLEKGYFVSPSIFVDVKPSMRIYREEIFGPCAAVLQFKDEDEAVRLANDSMYGLGSALFTENISKAHNVARRIEAGMVWVNSSNDSDFRVPFGGVKQSGIGRELGEAGLEAYYNVKAIHVNIGNVLPM
ncbi:probable aldehyde dehydrogenase [Fusarium mangiferae]|uniref:aldehyde dehydrogenase (NAD(+)) n=1 Tax=Fusarium mangiferae TaxID=192010 RepID=A0A1L7SJH4_FUSMA|nr:putative aldehyde dehydrogenase [Fusarium mangiferae]CVK83944.1 probable aldehyde dehydrogenase [Fusarium mangiferae]